MKKQSNLSKLMGYAGNFRFLTYASWILSGVSAAFALIPFYFLWRIIKEVLTVMPDFSKAAGLIHNGWMAVLFAALSLVIYICALMCSHLAAFRVQANLRKAMLHHVITLPLGTLEKEGSGKVRKTIQECSGATETFLAHQLPDMVGAYVTPLGLVVLLFAFDWRFGLICLIPIVLSFVVMMVFMTGPTLKVKMQEYQNALEDMSNEAVEYVRGVPVVKTFGQTVYSFEKFKKSIDRYSEWAISYTKSMRIPMCLLTILINGIFAFILAAGIWFTKGGISTTLVLNILFYIILTPILTVTMTKIMFQSENNMLLEDAMKRMDNILSLEPLKETQNAKNPKENSVELRHVSYSYDERTQALKDISLSIKGGQTVAFVGPSGGGKTTLANVISRFFDVKEGEVLIGGVNVKDISKEKLMETVSFVFQNSRLIKGTILDNVKLGKPDAAEEEVMTALRQAQCMDIVEKMPDGVHTVIGTNGVYLSGGEGQRIAIARAILKDTSIILLDEATSALDNESEQAVNEALRNLQGQKTILMIAHRPSTIELADRVCTMVRAEL